ncbi:hypothetical protein I545_6110 [Mycobacterium kansasii 662]|uniref:Uncharacterized protein n=1 Tax=Mycobacterium kansasii 662 TaxID=1299326 RepID=X7YR06_MYCKA|nr:hypothetical protein I545_6110 [Mycobacterium kansasii 662]KEP41508.1 hypothetical protein MKSMC1_33580 [Mycobacterium kansasii]
MAENGFETSPPVEVRLRDVPGQPASWRSVVSGCSLLADGVGRVVA